jgi:hypothetical protein
VQGPEAGPDLQIAGVSLWVVSRQFPNIDDYWDGNWLEARVRVEALGATVEATGTWLRTDEIAAFAEQLACLRRDLHGTAELLCMEPTFNMKLAAGDLGDVEMTVQVTPDHLTQSHRFVFNIDQTFLAAGVAGCLGIIDRFPVRGAPTRP